MTDSTTPIIGFLACPTTLPAELGGAAERRADAFEHDLMISALEPAFAEAGFQLRVIDWHAPMAAFADVALVMLGSSWDYQDQSEAFLDKLDALEANGVVVCNAPDLVRWNSQKTYLKELARRGAPTIPTLWLEDAGPDDVVAAMEELEADRVVVKRQVGAGGLGQHSFDRSAMPAANWRMGRPAMIQPFLPAILEDGEYSFLFVDGQFSHAVQKLAKQGEYRIQSMFGGTEADFTPHSADLEQAVRILGALPFATPLYARIDMVRLPDGQLALMELEMIEPYLYPQQGAELGQRLAVAVRNRLT